MDDNPIKNNEGIMEALGRIHSELATIKNNFDWIQKSLIETKLRLDKKEAEYEKKYASKWVESLSKGAIGAILLYFAGGLLGMFTIETGRAIASFYINLFS